MLKARRVKIDELAKTEELFRIAFEFPDQNAAKQEEVLKRLEENKERRFCKYALEKWAAFDEQGEMASYISAMRYTVRFDGHEVPMSGIGGVSSLPQYRRQGGIRKCFEACLRDTYDDGVVLSYLFPFSTKFYGQFGYEPCGRVAYYSIPLRAIDADKTLGGSVKPLYCGNIKKDVMQVYDDYTKAYNFSCVRDEKMDWDSLDKQDMSRSGQYIYVWYNDEGTPKGVIGFSKEKNATEKFDLQTRKMFWFSDSEGLRGLLQFARGFETYYRNLCVMLADDFPLNAYVREWAIYPYDCRVSAMGMGRIVNVKKALELAAYRGSGSIVIAVKDEILPENNGSFAVAFQSGKAVSVEKTDDQPDISLSVAMLSKFLLGECEASKLAHYPGVTVNCDSALAAQVFYKKPLLILDSF